MTTPWFPPNGVLDPDKHGRLVEQRQAVAKDANIPVEMLWKPLKGVVSKAEQEAVRGNMTAYPRRVAGQ